MPWKRDSQHDSSPTLIQCISAIYKFISGCNVVRVTVTIINDHTFYVVQTNAKQTPKHIRCFNAFATVTTVSIHRQELPVRWQLRWNNFHRETPIYRGICCYRSSVRYKLEFHWSCHWSCRGWTTATPRYRVFQPTPSADCSPRWMPLLVSCSRCRSTIPRRYLCKSCIGWRWSSGLSTSSLFSFTADSMALRHRTSPTTSSVSPTSVCGGACDRRSRRSSIAAVHCRRPCLSRGSGASVEQSARLRHGVNVAAHVQATPEDCTVCKKLLNTGCFRRLEHLPSHIILFCV